MENINLSEDELFEHHRFIADKGQEPLRIDKFLMNFIENATRNKIQNAAKAGNILVNGISVKQNYKVKPADVITIVMATPIREVELIPENIPLDIVFEDEYLMVINKPAGLVVHPGHGNYTGTLVNGLIYYLNSLPSLDCEFKNRPGLVHRIDKDTSGLLVIAKDEYTMTHLAKQFYDRKIDRIYYALVWGNLKDESGTITGYIGRDLKDRMIMNVFDDENNGKHSVTHYKIIQRFRYVTLVQCKLETGRTHQIRAHMKHIGHTLFNDQRYGGNKILKGTTFSKYKQFVENCFSVIPRQALHAKTLGFIHPVHKTNLFFESELPNDFAKAIKKWNDYSNQDLI